VAVKNPFKESDDEREAVENVGKPEDEEKSVEVSVADDDDDDDDNDDESPQPSRADKKRARGMRHREALEAVERERQARLEAENRALQYQQMMTYQQSQRPPAEPDVDPVEKEILETYETQRRIVAQASVLAEKLPRAEYEEIHKDFMKQSRAAEERRAELMAQKVIRKQGLEVHNIAQEAARQQFFSSISDVMSDPKARLLADGIVRQMWAEGKPDSFETARAAAEEARRRMGWNKRPAPTQSEKAKYTGMPAKTSGVSTAPQSNVVRLSPAQQKMANELFKHLPEKERYKRFAKNLAKKGA
jgi:hypothetical protein